MADFSDIVGYVLGTVIGIAVSIIGIWFFFTNGYVLGGVGVFTAFALVAWRILADLYRRYYGRGAEIPVSLPGRLTAIPAAAISIVIYGIAVAFGGAFGAQAPAMLTFGGGGPYTWPAALAIAQFFYGVYGAGVYLLEDFFASHASLRVGFALLVIALALTAFYYGPLQRDAGNLGKLTGEAGAAIDESLEAAGAPVQRVAAEAREVTDPCKNPSIARAQCFYEVYAEGEIYENVEGGSEIAKCVKEIRKSCQSTESKSIGQPQELRVRNIEIVPGIQQVRVRVPLHNTLVTDRRGARLEMPATVKFVNVSWWYEGDMVADKKSTNEKKISPGDTVVPGGGIQFSTVQQTSSRSDRQVLEWIENSSKNRPDALDNVEDGRIDFLIETSEDIAFGDVKWRNKADAKDAIMAGDQYSYQVRIGVRYKYEGVEAAFTDSSRWQSGDHLLELWTESAWNELSLSEQRSWKSEKCSTVRMLGRELKRQRTVAMPTPVKPVMYTYCGAALFEGLTKQSSRLTKQSSKDIPLWVSATVRDKWTDRLNEEKGFKLLNVDASDCGTRKVKKLGDKWVERLPSGAWAIRPDPMKKTVSMSTERKSIGCKVSMDITMNIRKQENGVVIPAIS